MDTDEYERWLMGTAHVTRERPRFGHTVLCRRCKGKGRAFIRHPGRKAWNVSCPVCQGLGTVELSELGYNPLRTFA